jgi:hypothetical protein
MSEQITASGVYDLSMPEYRGQPADAMSISSSDAVILTEQSPAHLRAAWAEPDDSSKEADLGTVIHALLLEPHRAHSSVVNINADDYRTKAAQNARDEARANGQTPLLARDYRRARRAVEAVQAHPIASQLLKAGRAETSWFAKDRKTGLYLKARPDFVTDDRVLVDIKSVGSANPDFLRRRLFDGRWFQQSAWHCNVVERVDGLPAKGYCWLCVEQKPPHAVVVRRPTDSVLMHGNRLNQEAFKIFARCVAEQKWPAYGLELSELDLPDFAYYRLEQEAEAERTPTDMRAVQLARETGAHVFS